MNWKSTIEDFMAFLRLEKALSANSIEAYMRDVDKLRQYIALCKLPVSPTKVNYQHLTKFIVWINSMGISARSQARILSGIKAFYKFLLYDDQIVEDPTFLIESPKIGLKLPDTLSIAEIDTLIDAIDLSKPEGHRNKAILETLYSCGLRVSELTHLRLSQLHFEQGFVKIIGKGKKERLIPISFKAIEEIEFYIDHYRRHLNIKEGSEDIVFLNRRGGQLTRVMIFTIIKNLAEDIELGKKISPHTFRHSFATHLVDGGADLRAVQEMLGHESIITTEIYTHLDSEYLRDTILSYHPRS